MLAKETMSFFSRIDAFDRKLTLKLRSRPNRILESLLKWMSLLNQGRWWLVGFLIVYLALLFYFPQSEELKEFFRASMAAVPAWAVSSVSKRLLRRQRPYQSLSISPPLAFRGRNDSMPSSHAAASCAFAGALYLAGNVLAPLAIVWALLVVFSRLYLGAHYLSDLMVGIFVGLSSSMLIDSLFTHTFL
jgi:undecaprenyl-diphosphatase